MKASQITKALCDAWEKGIPAKLKQAETAASQAENHFQTAKKSGQDPRIIEQARQVYTKAHGSLTVIKGAQGRVRHLRAAMDSMVDQFGDVEVPVK